MITTSKTEPFKFGTTYIIGSYILPGELNEKINNANNGRVDVSISNCEEVVAKLRTKELDLGIIETPNLDKNVIAKEWIEDELIICSNVELSPFIPKEDLYNYRLICQKDSSPIKKLIDRFFDNFNILYNNFYSVSKIDNTTASIQSVRWSKTRTKNPTITLVSSRAIEDEVKNKKLFMSRIENHNMSHKFYIVYHKDTDMKKIDSIIKELMKYGSKNLS